MNESDSKRKQLKLLDLQNKRELMMNSKLLKKNKNVWNVKLPKELLKKNV